MATIDRVRREVALLAITAELQQRRGYRWDGAQGRYISNWNNRPVLDGTVRRAVEDYGRLVTQPNLQNITERFVGGNIDLPTWQARMARELKDAYIVNLRVGRGPDVDFTDYGRIGGRLAFQYRHLNQFAEEIAQGTLTEAKIMARAQMYANSARTAYFDGLTAAKRAAEHTEERRVLNPAEHCPDCIGYAAQGWVPIGTLPEPGQASVCLTNCKCDKEYR